MNEPSVARCPNCRTAFPVPPEWRLERCPACGHPVARMDSDDRFD